MHPAARQGSASASSSVPQAIPAPAAAAPGPKFPGCKYLLPDPLPTQTFNIVLTQSGPALVICL